jgi:hypothetical protein
MNQVEFPQMVGVAQAVGSLVRFEVGLPKIMDRRASELGQDGYVVQRLRAPLLENPAPLPGFGAGGVQPVQLPFHSETAFVKVDHFCADQLPVDRFVGGLTCS